MKNQLVYIMLIAFGGVGFISCSQNQLAQNKEYDDLYYTSADRKAEVEAQPIAHRGAASGYSDQNFRKNGALAYEEENFSARKVNPDYISRYNVAEDDIIIEEVGEDGEYFVENYDQQQRSGTPNNIRNNNYYGRGYNNFGYSPFNDPFMMGYYDPFMMSPFMGPRFMRPGIHMSFGMSFGFGNAWGMGMYDPFWGHGYNNPYRMGMGMYDPFWGGGFYSPWGMGMNSYNMGYNRGYYNGMAYNNYYRDGNSPIRNTRTVVSGPRMSRSAIAGAGTTGVRSRTSERNSVNQRSSATTSRANARQASDLQSSNYYSRTNRNVTEQAVSRSAAVSSRRSIDGAAYSRNNDINTSANQRTNQYRTAPAGTNYNRSTAPARTQTRTTSPSNNSYRTAPSRSNDQQYRSAPSAPSRSTQQRTAPSSAPSRSNSTYSPSSAPSRSSGGSYTPSSAPSRSSAPARSAPSGGGSRRGN
ncbi:MAG: hypothetical protein M3512_04090 [Bacteroidota bacterium]|nr:hypothetical protein [Bacteroidota bacterium]